jgi:hypothetical protein
MTHPLTEMNIKQPIRSLVEREFASLLDSPGAASEEYKLTALGSEYRADFAFQIKTGGWCFIEDDSHGTCLSNLLKYAAWIDEHPPSGPVWVFHIISPEDSAWVRLCKRESDRLNSALHGFRHIIISTADWPENNQPWLEELEREMSAPSEAGAYQAGKAGTTKG